MYAYRICMYMPKRGGLIQLCKSTLHEIQIISLERCVKKTAMTVTSERGTGDLTVLNRTLCLLKCMKILPQAHDTFSIQN